ncbi:MAG: hypothetical protein MUE81_16370 [Thermoflexibacter sp.]|jgi:hypothetical protein|nr:hypothetical protein [Thermoflexibacter sp.]
MKSLFILIFLFTSLLAFGQTSSPIRKEDDSLFENNKTALDEWLKENNLKDYLSIHKLETDIKKNKLTISFICTTDYVALTDTFKAQNSGLLLNDFIYSYCTFLMNISDSQLIIKIESPAKLITLSFDLTDLTIKESSVDAMGQGGVPKSLIIIRDITNANVKANFISVPIANSNNLSLYEINTKLKNYFSKYSDNGYVSTIRNSILSFGVQNLIGEVRTNSKCALGGTAYEKLMGYISKKDNDAPVIEKIYGVYSCEIFNSIRVADTNMENDSDYKNSLKSYYDNIARIILKK